MRQAKVSPPSDDRATRKTDESASATATTSNNPDEGSSSSNSNNGASSSNNSDNSRRGRQSSDGGQDGDESGSINHLCSVCRCPIRQRHPCFHYGAVTCYSCRAFFRRGCQERTTPGGGTAAANAASGGGGTYAAARYKCKGSQTGRCDVTGSTMAKCKFCRFQRCLQAGMRPEQVLNQQEKHERFKLYFERKAKEAGEGTSSSDQAEVAEGADESSNSNPASVACGEAEVEAKDERELERIRAIRQDLEKVEEIVKKGKFDNEDEEGKLVPTAVMEIACNALCLDLMLGMKLSETNVVSHTWVSHNSSAEQQAPSRTWDCVRQAFRQACQDASRLRADDVRALTHLHREEDDEDDEPCPDESHFGSMFRLLRAQFERFLELLPQFNSLPDEERERLGARNCKLFLMFCFARYVAADSGWEQLKWLIHADFGGDESPTGVIGGLKLVAFFRESKKDATGFVRSSQATKTLLDLSLQLARASPVCPEEKHLVALLLAFATEDEQDGHQASEHLRQVQSHLHHHHFDTLCKVVQQNVLRLTSSMVAVFDAEFKAV